MAADTQSRADPPSNAGRRRPPEISACESRPGRAVFLESGNTDGWIATDTTVEASR